MDQKEIIKRYRKEVDKLSGRVNHLDDELAEANKRIEFLTRDKNFAAMMLNKIRETLLIKTDWNGAFSKGEDLATIVAEYIEKGFVKPRGI